MFRTQFRIGIVVLLLASGCSSPRLEEKRRVRGDFLEAHPDYTIVSIGEMDGNNYSTVVTFSIRYKKGNDQREYWTDWAYDTKGGKLVGKGSEVVFE